MLRLTKEDIVSLRDRLIAVRQQGATYFARANPTKVERQYREHSWEIESNDIRNEAETLRTTIKALSVDIAGGGARVTTAC